MNHYVFLKRSNSNEISIKGPLSRASVLKIVEDNDNVDLSWITDKNMSSVDWGLNNNVGLIIKGTSWRPVLDAIVEDGIVKNEIVFVRDGK